MPVPQQQLVDALRSMAGNASEPCLRIDIDHDRRCSARFRIGPSAMIA